VAQKAIFSLLGLKVNFSRIKSAAKFCCVKTSSKVVEQSISYEITKKYRTESVSFHLKYWLKLTYPIVARTVHAISSALPNDVTSKMQCRQLHNELFGRRHSTLQSHGPFALAKHLFHLFPTCESVDDNPNVFTFWSTPLYHNCSIAVEKSPPDIWPSNADLRVFF